MTRRTTPDAAAFPVRALRGLQMICLGAKSHFRSLWRLLLGALVPPLLVAGAFAAAGPVVAGLFSQDRLALVFCDLEGSAFFDSLMNLMLSDESAKRTASVRKLGYDEAFGELSGGRADAVVIFPETFISDMAAGINNPVLMYGSEADPVRSVVVREFMRSAAAELSAAQSAINTVWFSVDRQEMSGLRRTALFTSLVMEYTGKAFARSLYYTFKDVPPGFEGGSPMGFLLASALAVFVFFGAFGGVRQVLAERGAGITVRLRSAGFSRARLALYSFAPVYARQLICACVAAALALPVAAAAVKAADMERETAEAIYGSASAAAQPGSSADVGSLMSGIIGAGAGETDAASADVASADFTTPGGSGETAGTSSIPLLLGAAMAGENMSRLPRVFGVLAALCLPVSAAALLLGSVLKRPEPAEIIIVTAGIAMPVAGGTLIPYTYLPEYFQSFGPFCFHYWAQKLIFAAYFAAPGENVWAAPALFVTLAVFAALLAAAAWKLDAY